MESFNKPSTPIKNWAIDERPREKLVSNGPHTLSNSELLGILINNGNKDKSAIDIAKDVLYLGGQNLNELGKLSLKDLQKVKGIGMAKAITISAALELGRRRNASASLERPVIRSGKDIARYLQITLQDFTYEVFAVAFLNQANKVNHFEIISKGGITATVADPRIILKRALEEDATALVLCHNHPSGNLRPSQADEELTKKLKEAASLFDIKIIDHIIVSEDGFYSFADNGKI